MSKPPVILFGDFTLDEATHFQQLESGSEVDSQSAPEQSTSDGPSLVRFGSVDPTVHIAHSPPPLPPTAPAHPPYPHHHPPYVAGNHPSHYLQIPPPHFGPHRPFYPAPYYPNNFGTFPHPGGPPLPYGPDYLYGRPILPLPHPYPGPVDHAHTLGGLSSAPLGVLQPASGGWRPHPLASPPLQPDRGPQTPGGLPDFPSARQPSWHPPGTHFPPADMPPFHQERPQSPGSFSAGAPQEERPQPAEELASEQTEEVHAPVEGAMPAQTAAGQEDGPEPDEGPADAAFPGAHESPQSLVPPEEQDDGSRPQGEEDEQTAPTGWGQASSGESTELAVADEGTADEAMQPAEPGPSPVSSSPTPTPAVAPKPKTWAALVGKAAGQCGVQYQMAQPGVTRTSYSTPKLQERAPVAKGGAKPQLSGPAWTRMLRETASLRLQPRGLVNTGNSCFLNATLQALFACPPFLLLVNQLKTCELDQDEYPMLYALVSYLVQFDPLPAAPVKPTPGGGVDVGTPFSPDMFVDVLQRFSPNTQHRGLRRARQEDAQEFLSYVMDRMHEELLKLESAPVDAPPPPKVSNGPLLNGAWGGSGGDADEEWETVGAKNKSAVTRMHTHADSALSSIFGGSLQSLVKTKGTKASATVQPFTIVQLDIASEVVRSVEDALQLFAAPETLDGYRPSGRAEVAASKLLKLGTLPRVLVLHLMRFSFSGDRGLTKVHKPVKFPPTLTIPIKLLTSPPAPAELRRYELVATVSHIGKDPSGGHYTADARQEDGRWLRFDDSTVSVVNLNKVLHDQAYLLLYKRVVQ